MKKDFRTNDLEGNYVVIQTIWEEKRIAGRLLKYFNSNNAITLRDYVVLQQKDGKWEPVERGEIIVISPKYYQAICVPKVEK